MSIDVNDIQENYKTIQTKIRKTPLMLSDHLSTKIGSNVYLKLELLQITGSFKVRGALTKIAKMFELIRKSSPIIPKSWKLSIISSKLQAEILTGLSRRSKRTENLLMNN